LIDSCKGRYKHWKKKQKTKNKINRSCQSLSKLVKGTTS
jgi:hypothetical protein